MPSTTGSWISEAIPTATTWTLVGDVRNAVYAYDKLIITARCVTAPASGNMSVKVQHSANYNDVESSAAAWEDLADLGSYDSAGAGTQKTVMLEDFHSVIRIVAINSVASMSPVLSVYIREKQFGAD
jgi:hypothetical protein